MNIPLRDTYLRHKLRHNTQQETSNVQGKKTSNFKSEVPVKLQIPKNKKTTKKSATEDTEATEKK